MNQRYFLFSEGHIEEVNQTNPSEGELLYFKKAPRNFMELSDELKKLSFLCDGVYVTIVDNDMEILLYKRDSLELFTKLHMSSTRCLLPINERLRDYLFQINDK